jgi:hypothetical protein
MKYLFILLLLVGCNSNEQEKEIVHPIIKTEFIANSTLWDLKQYFGENKDVPKYTAYGTYTNKHIPLAYWANDTLYHVFTDVNPDGNFYVYAAKDNTEIVRVYTIENWDDPHTNAIIYVDDQGYVFVHIASRGSLSKFQSGKILKSKYPYELDFDCIDGCENVNFEAYPQVWLTKWGKHIGYTHYIKDTDIHPKKASRQLWYRVGDERKLLVKGGHYAISHYDGEYLWLAYNHLINANADNRVNLYLIKTKDGGNWVNVDNKPLELPLEPHSDESLIYESDGYVYLKDIQDGKISFVESSDFDPTVGNRHIKEWDNGEIKTISETNHNYNSSSYFGEYIITTQDGVAGFGGGDMVLYYNGAEVFRDNSNNWNYVRKAVNNKKTGVVSSGFSGGTGQHYILKLDI